MNTIIQMFLVHIAGAFLLITGTIWLLVSEKENNKPMGYTGWALTIIGLAICLI